ncbi:MAG: hypothetical protein QOJ52_1040 [Acidimicrobiaceae bacterium]|nr:hypothetical protein [Acidimicrobiaceae bacterium]MDQ1419078.1 hypothetical protein [Acidimicrobiaceae bacterium]MDQ1440449.1 hypothetical protein [Acidimicrobiaceae bacterium]
MSDLGRGRRLVLLVTSLALLAAGLAVVATGGADKSVRAVTSSATTTTGPALVAPVTPGTTLPEATLTPTTPTTAVAVTTAPSTTRPVTSGSPIGPVALTGCPPSHKPPAATAPGHPAVLVPESALPAPPAAAPKVVDLAALSGKGMWIWQQNKTSGGSVDLIVRQAVGAGLRQVWVRVGSSLDGFYGQTWLNALVPALHRAGVAVIGWGFPYLYDPVADVAWTNQALTWRSPGGDRLDGWSADIETGSEGTALSGKRAATYLGLVRPQMGGRPLIATVYPPTDYWLAHYPYQAMVPYIDAFAPMLYWSCVEPGAEATMALQKLAGMAPVHLIGQAFDMGPYGGRDGSPSGAEIARFLDVARRGGAKGASFWVWQYMTAPEWAALSAYPWRT